MFAVDFRLFSSALPIVPSKTEKPISLGELFAQLVDFLKRVFCLGNRKITVEDPLSYKKINDVAERSLCQALNPSVASTPSAGSELSSESSSASSSRSVSPGPNTVFRKRVDQDICGKDLQLGPKNWAAKVITHYQIEKGKNCYGTTIKLDLPFSVKTDRDFFDGHSYYVELQNQIAQLKEGEDDARKPIIDLKLRGENTNIEDPSEFAIIGGVGCLADADLLDQVIGNLKAQGADLSTLKISLFSNPPPRHLSEMHNCPDFLGKTLKFLHKDHKRFYIGSNTAHLNFGVFNNLRRGARVFNTVGNRIGLCDALEGGRGVNLVQKIAQDLKGKAGTTLILGTTQAHEGKLYPNEFTPLGIAYAETTFEEQTIIQEEINKQKHSELKDEGLKLYQTIGSIATRLKAEGKSIQRILLGCTELPAIVEKYKEKIKQEFGVEIIDSQSEFASHIARSVA